jgi:NHL repeat
MMCPVRRQTVALAGLVLLASTMATGAGAAASGAADPAATALHTVLGPGVLDGPGGLAYDAAGNLFVADTGHCRVLVVPTRTGVLDGVHGRAGRASTLVGASCTGRGNLGHPSDVAVDGRGDVFIAEPTAQRVQELRAGARTVVTVAGTGTGGAGVGELNEPTGVAVDGAGDLFIADTANCRVMVLPAVTGTLFGLAVRSGGLSTVAGTGVCGNAGRGGAPRTAQLWDPVAVAFDTAGDLLVADSGDQSVLLAPSGKGGTFYGSTIGAGDIGVVMGGTGSYGPYLVDGLPANGPTAELNDPRGLAVGPTGALFVTDGFMHVIRVVPAASETLFGTPMKAGDLYTVAGALPAATAAGSNDGTKWKRTHMGTPVGVAVNATGALAYADATQDTVRVMGAGAGSS